MCTLYGEENLLENLWNIYVASLSYEQNQINSSNKSSEYKVLFIMLYHIYPNCLHGMS